MQRRRALCVLSIAGALSWGVWAMTPVFAGGKPGGKPGGGGEDPPTTANPRIVYSEFDGNQYVIKKADANGANATLVLRVDATYGRTDPDPSWSPDRLEIAFRGYDADGVALFVVADDGSGLRSIVPGSAFQGIYDPTWSPAAAPDGEQKIAFAASPDGVHGQIHVCNSDGSERQNVTADLGRSDMTPAWSPDATRIAAGTSTTTVLPRGIVVYALKIDGTSVAKDTMSDATSGTALDGARLGSLDWSPSGNVLVLSVGDTNDALHDDLWTLDLDDGKTAALTATEGKDETTPSWSPDGTKIVLRLVGYKKEAKSSGLYVMNANGSGLTPLSIADGWEPDWR